MTTRAHPPRPAYLDPLFDGRSTGEVSRTVGIAQPSAHAWSTGESLPDPGRLSESSLRRLAELLGDGTAELLRTEGWTIRDLARVGALAILLARDRQGRAPAKKIEVREKR